MTTIDVMLIDVDVLMYFECIPFHLAAVSQLESSFFVGSSTLNHIGAFIVKKIAS